MKLASTDRGHDAVRRVLATAGVAGTALTLSAAAALPAIASSGGSHAHGSHGSSSSGAQSSNSSSGGSHSQSAGGHGASATGSKDTSGHNPPGNNGTVFIHDLPGDHSPHNVPHVSCNFYVDFFGFDNGQSVTVSFAGQAPTGKDMALGGTWTGVVSTDDASGAGNDFDDELAFTADQLGVTSLGAPAHQGYHVKMTVATNEPGGKKSKVFWITPCAPVVGGTTGGGTISGTSGGETAGGGVLGSGTAVGGATGGASVGAAGAPNGGATVLGERFTKPAVSGSSASALPFTGADIWRMVAAGLVALLGGVTVLLAARRRRYDALHG